MSHITTYPMRNPHQFFGQDYYPQKLAQTAIEHTRLDTENAILRNERDSWKRQAQEAMADRGEIALRLAELMERETALVASISQYEAKEELLNARLERADHVHTAQRMRIDEMSKLNTEYCSEIERLEETVSKLRAELTEVLGAGGLEILIAETGQ